MKNKVSNLILIAVITGTMHGCIPNTGLVQPSASVSSTVSPAAPLPTGTPVPSIPSGTAVPTPVIASSVPSPAISAVTTPSPSASPVPASTPEPSPSYSVVDAVVSTIAGGSFGNTNNDDSNSHFLRPMGIAVDFVGNIYVADTGNHKIRKIDGVGKVITLAGSFEGFVDEVPATAAQFSGPTSIIIDSKNNFYVTDTKNNRIRKVSFDGEVTTFSGSDEGFQDGTLTRAKYNQPAALIVDRDGNFFITDTKNSSIRKISAFKVNTIHGNGQPGFKDAAGLDARFNDPNGLTMDFDNNIYIADTKNHVIRKINTDGLVTTFAGSPGNPGFSDGSGSNARFNSPMGITYASTGFLYVSDTFNNKIRRISSDGVVTTVSGNSLGFADGLAAKAMFNHPVGITSDLEGKSLFIADSENNRIRKIAFE
jgi:sugar lactone lactonase YvrE